ncbi:MAG TPA: nuclear transport factor 2 family protein [Vicinamibacterales bacterium]|nr:nuclear transport factor 2 family protein [Vicinamibacterales bacterium]
MNTIILAISLMAFGQVPTSTADQKAVVAVVNQFTDAFNKGDTKAAAATCAEQTSIIDEFPPHEWHGAGACAKWMADYDADAKKNGITDGSVKLSAPKHVDVTADRAYVVVPADYSYKQKGKPVKETSSLLTVALQKSAAGWRITGWSWSKN